jgi:hypothetical protein
MQNLAICLQALVAAAIFFVWVVRYANIVEEFKQFGLPEWLRDLVGILKLTFAAFVTLLRVGNPPFKMLPSLALLVCSGVITWVNYGRFGG